MDWHNGWGWMWMGLMMILFWGGLIVLVVLLLRGGGFGGRKDETGTPASGPDASEILRGRFARGEIHRGRVPEELDRPRRDQTLTSFRQGLGDASEFIPRDRALGRRPSATAAAPGFPISPLE
jgi:putative membrane protein